MSLSSCSITLSRFCRLWNLETSALRRRLQSPTCTGTSSIESTSRMNTTDRCAVLRSARRQSTSRFRKDASSLSRNSLQRLAHSSRSTRSSNASLRTKRGQLVIKPLALFLLSLVYYLRMKKKAVKKVEKVSAKKPARRFMKKAYDKERAELYGKC